MMLAENVIIKPGIGGSSITWPHRVLAVERERDLVILIKFPGEPNEQGKIKTHIDGPVHLGLHDLENQLERGTIAVTKLKAAGAWSMTDQDYVAAGKNETERTRRQERLRRRDQAWQLIEPIVRDESLRDIALDTRKRRTRILKQATERGLNPTTVYRTLHIYMASGGVLNSLIPATDRCGAPGKEKEHRTKLGRPSRVAKADPDYKPYVLQESDKQRLATGFLLARKTVSQHDAYLLTCAAHWSVITNETGRELKLDLLPEHLRPTFSEFKHWGRRLNTTLCRKRRLGIDRLREKKKITAGSTQDQVVAIGQIAMLDSTSTDVYLTSMWSRRKKLPPMHRTIVKEIRSTAVIGFYVGWESPSSATSLLAILSSAESKIEICRRFGITITDDDWPFFLSKLFLVDNGEMKAQILTEAERQFRFGIEYVKAYNGQGKSSVENQHHTDHKRLDHKLEGATFGRARERGEDHPALGAIWNFWEYMHEYIQMIIAYNNEEVPHLAPTAMKKAGIKPTRINVMKWLMERNMRADVPYEVEQLRAFTMPSVPAVMTANGIHLLMPNSTRRLPGHRFYLPELQVTPAFRKALEKDGSVPIFVKCASDDLSCVWFATDDGLLKIPNVEADDDLLCEGTLTDWIQYIESEDLRKDLQRTVRDQEQLDTLLRRKATATRGKRQLAAEDEAAGKKQSKASTRANLKSNRAEEMRQLRAQDSTALGDPPETEQATSPMSKERIPSDAAVSAMDDFMRDS